MYPHTHKRGLLPVHLQDDRETQNTYGRVARWPLPFRELYLHLFASRVSERGARLKLG